MWEFPVVGSRVSDLETRTGFLGIWHPEYPREGEEAGEGSGEASIFI